MLTLMLTGVLAGAVTAVSPCVLPVLPAVFLGAGSAARTRGATGDTDASRSGSAVLIVLGLVLSFATLTLCGSMLVTALRLPDGVLRAAGLIVLFLGGLGLVSPVVQRILQHPFARVPQPDAARASGPLVLGVALGALYVPCAGPVIAAIAIAGASGRVDGGVVVLTAAFSVGTAIPLLLFASAGQRIGGRLSHVRTGARRFRVASGVALMVLAVALTFNLTDAVQRWAPTYTATIQDTVENNDAAQQALHRLSADGPEPGSAPDTDAAAAPGVVPAPGPVQTCRSGAETLANCGPAAELVGLDTWINTQDGQPVTMSELSGNVVLVDFWTSACINCQHVLPFVTSWFDTYRGVGLEVIGVHTPEFAFERDPETVRAAVTEQSIHYPVGLDNSSATWRNYHNSYWPAAYLIDATGTLRYVKFGEGDYQHTEALIRQLLRAANPSVVLPPPGMPPS